MHVADKANTATRNGPDELLILAAISDRAPRRVDAMA
jgi:hypothetical protein